MKQRRLSSFSSASAWAYSYIRVSLPSGPINHQMITKFRRSTQPMCVQWRWFCYRNQREHFFFFFANLFIKYKKEWKKNKALFFTSLKIGLFEFEKGFLVVVVSRASFANSEFDMGTSRLCPSHRFKNIIFVNWLMSLIVKWLLNGVRWKYVIKLHWFDLIGIDEALAFSCWVPTSAKQYSNKTFTLRLKASHIYESTFEVSRFTRCDKITAYRPRANLEILYFFCIFFFCATLSKHEKYSRLINVFVAIKNSRSLLFLSSLLARLFSHDDK